MFGARVILAVTLSTPRCAPPMTWPTRSGIATPLADLCAQLWEAAAHALDERANHTQVLRYMEGLVGQG